MTDDVVVIVDNSPVLVEVEKVGPQGAKGDKGDQGEPRDVSMFIEDAPNDGKLYVRRNGLWEELVIS